MDREREGESRVHVSIESGSFAVYISFQVARTTAAAVSKRRDEEHYSLKYSWVPQPLLHDAVNHLYYERTFRDVHRESRVLDARDFHEEIAREGESSQVLQRQVSLLDVVDHTTDRTPVDEERDFDNTTQYDVRVEDVYGSREEDLDLSFSSKGVLSSSDKKENTEGKKKNASSRSLSHGAAVIVRDLRQRERQSRSQSGARDRENVRESWTC